MATQEIQQSRPGPICEHVNKWTYACIALATGANEAAAKTAARAEAVRKAKVKLTAQRRVECPGSCRKGQALKGNKAPVPRHVYTYEDTDAGVWVSFYTARFYVRRDCTAKQDKVSHSFTDAVKALPRMGADPACGKTRYYSRLALGFGSGNTKKKARTAAAKEAKDEADDKLAVAKKKVCPKACEGGQMTAPAASRVTKLDVQRIPQVKSTTYVAYATAHWLVTLRCPAKAKKKEKKKRWRRA